MATIAASAARPARAAKGARGAGGKAATRRAPAGAPSKLERDRAAIQAIKDTRQPEPEAKPEAPAPASAQTAAVPPPTSSGGGPTFVVPAAASTGSGFLLGVVVWAVGLAYLRGGAAEVRRLIRAKAFNKVEG